MEKIIYLFGAGASCGSLPTYNNFRKRFSLFIGFFEHIRINNISVTVHELAQINPLVSELKKIEDELRFHNTPDTIAKKYFHKGEIEKLFVLKCVLTLFFLYEQNSIDDFSPIVQKKPLKKDLIDKRYDSFIASLLKPIKNRLEFLEHVNVLTWNYDLQFELAYSRYSHDNLVSIQESIQGFPKVFSKSAIFSEDKFSLIHLNGIAFPFPFFGGNELFIDPPKVRNKEYCLYLCELDERLKKVSDNRGDFYSLISFAWENLEHDYQIKKNEIIEKAIAATQSTKILIVNGYSFPIFNRAIDVKIVQNMKPDKIYIQSPNAKNLIPLVTRIFEGRLNANQVEDVGYWDQFFIPDWLIDTSGDKPVAW